MPLLITSGKLAIRDVVPCLVFFTLMTSQFDYLTLSTLLRKRGKPIADTGSNPYKWEKKKNK